MPVAVAAVSGDGLQLDELDEFLTERLARYKHPKGLEIVDALPRNPAGKVLKTELRTRFSAAPRTRFSRRKCLGCNGFRLTGERLTQREKFAVMTMEG